jgi:hypothetical protein
MAMLAPVHVENVGRLFGSNQPISAHFTAFNSSDQLQQKRFDLYTEALHKFTPEERNKVIETVNDLRFADLTPAQIVATWLRSKYTWAQSLLFFVLLAEKVYSGTVAGPANHASLGLFQYWKQGASIKCWPGILPFCLGQ